jgi:hypothetical protein
LRELLDHRSVERTDVPIAHDHEVAALADEDVPTWDVASSASLLTSMATL